MRGLADIRGQGKEQMIGQFHHSISQWKKFHRGAPTFNVRSGGLIGIFDGIWFTIGGVRYTCLVILVRPVRTDTARLRGLYLVQGNESEANWRQVLQETITEKELARIRAIVADGSHGLVALSQTHGWKYQRCQFHLLKDLQLISGKRSGATQALRQTANSAAGDARDSRHPG